MQKGGALTGSAFGKGIDEWTPIVWDVAHVLFSNHGEHLSVSKLVICEQDCE